jgi:hypothetical protein
MSLAADSPSPSLSSPSDDDDFADLLAAELELELSSVADSAPHADPSASPASDHAEEGEDDVVVEVDAVEQGRYARPLPSFFLANCWASSLVLRDQEPVFHALLLLDGRFGVAISLIDPASIHRLY